ncbi:hypothetical protein [Aeromonas caviae]|uniref:hypothetical protein n=1 Tax=Aeromonas caviae TaxID=648 RepID=UPI0038D1895D
MFTLEFALNISSILGDAGQFLIGLFAITLSIYTFVKKRRDIFQSELAKSQFIEVGLVRAKLSQLFYDVYYVSQTKFQLEAIGWGLEEYRVNCPEEWEQYSRYKDTSLELFYKLSTPNYYLFPDWVSREMMSSHIILMKDFAPFTINATGKNSQDNIQVYQNSILALIDHLDVELRKHA